MNDAARQPFGDRGLADAGIADEQRVVLLTAAQHLDGAADFGIPADQRIDLAVARLLVEVHAVIVERVALLLGLLAGFLLGLLVDAPGRPRFGEPRPLGDAVADVVHRIVACHLLLLQEIAAWLSRSAKIATSTLAPVTSSRPDDCTWITARWITRWKPAVGLESSPPSVTSSQVPTPHRRRGFAAACRGRRCRPA